MTHVSLFTGIGGLDLAAEAAGFETVLQVEREPYALRVLERHWPDVKRITDVREVTLERVQEIMADSSSFRYRKNKIQRREQNQTRTSSGLIDGGDAGLYGKASATTKRPPVTVVSGGFPCQPFSAAGKRRGADDDRYLWPELLRIVEELRPSWVIGENVSGLLSIDGGLEIDRMLAALEARDYSPWILHYPAAGVGAPHKRDRVFIVGYSKGTNDKQSAGKDNTGRQNVSGRQAKIWFKSMGPGQAMADFPQHMCDGSGGTRRRRNEHSDGREDVADTECECGSVWQAAISEGKGVDFDTVCAERLTSRRQPQSRMGGMADGLPDWVHGEPADVPRVASGVKDRAARLKALGNAVVPAQAYPIFAAIAYIEYQLEGA